MLAKEQVLLTVSNGGFGKRTSSFDYRVTGRGGQGVTNMSLTKKNGGQVVATFPVTNSHQIMLVTDGGQLIRTPVETVRTTGRSAQGVTIFKVREGENVVSVAWLINDDDDDAGEEMLDEDGNVIEGEVVVEDGGTDAEGAPAVVVEGEEVSEEAAVPDAEEAPAESPEAEEPDDQ